MRGRCVVRERERAREYVRGDKLAKSYSTLRCLGQPGSYLTVRLV